MYHQTHGVHVPPLVQRCSARPRGAMPQGAGLQIARPHDRHARHGSVVINMTLDLVVVAFSPTALADHVPPHVVTTFLKWDMVCLVFFLTLFQGK